jgi:FkbM family methyltransferase
MSKRDQMLRRIVERISRNVVLERRLPQRFGGSEIYVSPDASLKLWKRDLYQADPQMFDWASEFVREGDVVWDVGANVGLFSFAASFIAGPVGRVIAFEADSFLAELIRRSTQRARGARLDVISAAISECCGVAEFDIAKRGRSTNHLHGLEGSTQTGGTRQTISVATLSLDRLHEQLPPPQVLKIDVEGGELNVLKGAQKLISTASPVILCEVSCNGLEIADLLHANGYELFDLQIDSRRTKRLDTPAFNTLAWPHRRSEFAF